MLVCTDVDYRVADDGNTFGVAAGIWFESWQSDESAYEHCVSVDKVEDYEPGQFYKRELPCLLRLLQTGWDFDIVIVDGYVEFGEDRPGLGSHLYEALDRRRPVVGVAKSKFVSATRYVSVCRGEGSNPIHVTSIGIEVSEAAKAVRSMAGEYRIPTLLKRVDTLARTYEPDLASHDSENSRHEE